MSRSEKKALDSLNEPSRTQRSARKLDRKQALTLAARGLSPGEIGKIQGVHRTTVWRFLERLKPERQAVQKFKIHRADLFARLQARELDLKERILDNLGKDRVFDALTAHQKTSLYHTLTISSGTSYDKERLERGESTQNIGLLTRLLSDSYESLHQENKKSEVVKTREPTNERLMGQEGNFTALAKHKSSNSRS